MVFRFLSSGIIAEPKQKTQSVFRYNARIVCCASCCIIRAFGFRAPYHRYSQKLRTPSADGYTSSASCHSAPSPQGEGFCSSFQHVWVQSPIIHSPKSKSAVRSAKLHCVLRFIVTICRCLCLACHCHRPRDCPA